MTIRVAKKVKALLYPHMPDYLSYKKGNKKDILVFASRRSGSTHTARLLSCDRGVRYIDQPFDLFKPHTKAGRIKSAHLPPVPYSQFITLSDGQEAIVQRYLDLILNGKLKPLGVIENWAFPFLANRTVLKICNASPLIDWINDRFDVSIVYLLRHPIPQALSVIRNKWGLTTEAYINNEAFSTSHLDDKIVKLSHDVNSRGTYFQKALVNWCLENIVPLKHPKSEVLTISYEELVLNPMEMIRFLSKQLELTNIRDMLNIVRVPSQAPLSEEKTRKAIHKEEREFLIGHWRDQVSDDQLDDVKKILETFEISEYRVDRFMPIDKLLHFPCNQRMSGL